MRHKQKNNFLHNCMKVKIKTRAPHVVQTLVASFYLKSLVKKWYNSKNIAFRDVPLV